MKKLERCGTMCTIRIMARCKICFHSERQVIDQEIIAGRPLRTLAVTYHASLGSLHRHKIHIREILAEAMRAQEGERAERGRSLVDRVERLICEAEDICSRAKDAKAFAAATNALNAIGRSLELLGKLSGEIATPNAAGIHLTMNRTTVNNINVGADDDVQVAVLVGEATGGFNLDEFARLKLLAQQGTSRDLPDGPGQLADKK